MPQNQLSLHSSLSKICPQIPASHYEGNYGVFLIKHLTVSFNGYNKNSL